MVRAFGAMGEALARNARKGDQLFIEARCAPATGRQTGEKQYDIHSSSMASASVRPARQA